MSHDDFPLDRRVNVSLRIVRYPDFWLQTYCLAFPSFIATQWHEASYPVTVAALSLIFTAFPVAICVSLLRQLILNLPGENLSNSFFIFSTPIGGVMRELHCVRVLATCAHAGVRGSRLRYADACGHGRGVHAAANPNCQEWNGQCRHRQCDRFLIRCSGLQCLRLWKGRGLQ